MRCPSVILTFALALAGCAEPSVPPGAPPATATPTTALANVSVTYDPTTFRADITRLIAAKQYREAVALVKVADVEKQLAVDGGYMGVGMDMIFLPGVYPQIEYDRARDWYVPGTQDAIQDGEWQRVATEFAERYNLRRRGMSE